MSTDLNARTLIFKYDGVYDMKGTYKIIKDWLTERGFIYEEPGWKEKQASPIGREVTIKIKGWRKTTEYVKYWITLEWKGFDTHDVETADGRKLQYQRFWMRLGGKVEYDWQNIGKGEPWYKKLYDKYLFKMEWKLIYTDEIELMTQDLYDTIQKFIGSESQKHEREVLNG